MKNLSIIGNIGSVSKHNTPDEKYYIRFTVAVNSPGKKDQEQQTTWFTCFTSKGKEESAFKIYEILKKGKSVYVSGSFSAGISDGKGKSGEQQLDIIINVRDFTITNWKNPKVSEEEENSNS